MDEKTISYNNSKRRIVGVLFALLMFNFASAFLTLAVYNVKTIIAECKTLYYSFDYNFINKQTAEDFKTREDHLRTSYHSFAENLLSNCTLLSSCKRSMIDTYGITVKFLDLYKPVPNAMFVKLTNNQLSFYGYETVDTVIYASYLIDFKKYLEKRNIAFVYVQAPHKNYKYQPAIPIGIADNNNAIFDRLVHSIENETSVIDMRDYFKMSPEKHYQLFYPGDSHWKPEYIFITTQELMKYFHNNCSCIIDPKVNNLDNYELVISNKKRNDISRNLGNYYYSSDQEYEQILIPKFETNMTIVVDSTAYQGPYNPQLLCQTKPAISVNNVNAVNNKRIMIIGDSFSPQVMSYLTLNFTDVEYHGLLFYTDNLFDDIERFNPDIVVLLLTARIVEVPGESINPSTKRYFETLIPPKEKESSQVLKK